MKRQDFYFDLPSELIAQYPLERRSDSKLLIYSRNTGEHSHQQFKNLADFLRPGDLLIMNDSKVIPARLYGQKATGGKVELLVERITGERVFLAHIKASKALKAGSIIHLKNAFKLKIRERQDDLYLCETETDVSGVLRKNGRMPLPPYITREDEPQDVQRYQTVYARHEGSIAAPTAGLHFDNDVLESLFLKGVNIGYVTLHVGAGTFRPLRCEHITDHKMHSERYTITQALCKMVNDTKIQGGRIIAAGTTALRSLESAVVNGQLQPHSEDTDIFIYPGYQFKICDGLLTNFHLPESTLLMLVSAFIGCQETRTLYAEAIKHNYRFFSYGDASLLL